MTAPIRLTYVDHKRDARSDRSADLPWPELAQHLTSHVRRPDKDGPGFVPARFHVRCECAKDNCPGEHHRVDAAVEAVTALVLDFDKGMEERLQRVVGDVRARGWAAVVYTTHSDSPAQRKLRIVIELACEVAAADWRPFWHRLVDLLGVRDVLDTGCKNPSRFYYWPSCPPSSTPEAYAFDGAPLDPAQILGLPASPHELDSPRSTSPTGTLPETEYPPASPELLAYAQRRLEEHGPSVRGAGGDRHAFQVGAILLNDLALSPDEAWPLAVWWRDRFPENTWTDEKLAAKVYNGAAYAHGARGADRERVERTEQLSAQVAGLIPVAPTAAPMIIAPPPLVVPVARLAALASEVARREKSPIRSYSSGLPQLDALIGGGLTTRQLLTVLGPPGAGKSALAVSVALFIAATIPVLYASTELESDEVVARLAASVLGCPWTEVVRGRVAVDQVAAALAGLRVHVIGCENLPHGDAALATICGEASAIGAESGVAPLVILDYVQDLARGGKEDGVRGRVGELAASLRAVAQGLDCPMLVVSSVSRSYYGIQKQASMRACDDPTVYLAAAKESGDVDYASAVVLFLDVDAEVEAGQSSKLARIAVAKSRHGQTGFVGARFFGASGRWVPAVEAVTLMAIEGRTTRRQDAKAIADDAKLLATIGQHSQAWRDVRLMSGITPLTDADASRARLLKRGAIEAVQELYFDSLHRAVKRNVYRVVGAPPPEPPATSPVTPRDPVLAALSTDGGAS